MADTTTIGNNPEQKTFASTETPVAATTGTASGGFSASDEMELNVSVDQLSFICEYCGKVNAISSPSCVRCGKRRPRSEYINAMNRLKNANSIKNQYIEEQAKLAADRQDAAQEQLVRLVESRVADERAQIMAQDEIRLEQERDNIKRATARDAVLRVIAAERAADERVKNAEIRAESALKERDRVAEESIAAEREQILYSAAKRVVSERAGIESAAEDRIQAERKHYEIKAQDEIEYARDEAEKIAARKAVLKVMASEQAAEDKTRLERDAITRAAMERISEERRMAEIDAYAKYKIEKEAIERATDERIKAERAMLYQMRGQAPVGVSPAYVGEQQASSVQPFAIVPYVNSRQPLYQYNTMKQVYKFVPDTIPQEQPAVSRPQPIAQQPVKKKKNAAVVVLSLISLLFGIVLVLVTALGLDALEPLKFIDGGKPKNLDILLALFQNNSYKTLSMGDDLWFIAPVAIAVMCVGAIICIIMGLVGIIKGRTSGLFLIGAILALIGAVGTAVGLYVIDAYKEIADCLQSIGLIIIIAISLLLFIFALICVIISKKEKKRMKNAPEAMNQNVAYPYGEQAFAQEGR